MTSTDLENKTSSSEAVTNNPNNPNEENDFNVFICSQNGILKGEIILGSFNNFSTILKG